MIYIDILVLFEDWKENYFYWCVVGIFIIVVICVVKDVDVNYFVDWVWLSVLFIIIFVWDVRDSWVLWYDVFGLSDINISLIDLVI